MVGFLCSTRQFEENYPLSFLLFSKYTKILDNLIQYLRREVDTVMLDPRKIKYANLELISGKKGQIRLYIHRIQNILYYIKHNT